jgi:hypothetical protein
MPEILALTGLVIATLLYALLVRRRSIVRFAIDSMSRALSASNEVAMARLRTFRGGSAAPAEDPGDWRDRIVVADRRSGKDRRRWFDRRRGRGRRTGGDRRRGTHPA